MVCFHTIKKKDPKFKRFQFVCQQICNWISLRADLPPEKAYRHGGYNRIEVFANVRSCKRAWTRVIYIFPVKLLPSLEWLGVWGLIDNLTWWRHIRARYAQPHPLQKFGPYAYDWLWPHVECIALKVCVVIKFLLLQKPHAKSRTKEHTAQNFHVLNLLYGHADYLVHIPDFT